MSQTVTTDTTTTTGDEPGSGTGDEPKTLTLTQDKLDAIISSRLTKEREKYGDYDELKAKAAKADELEAASLSDLERAQRERDEAKAAAEKATSDAAAAVLNAQKLAIALAAGLPADAADRLKGGTEDELKADAETLAALLKPAGDPKKGDEDDLSGESLDGGTRRKNGKGMTRADVQRLARDNPNKFNEMVDKGEIDLSNL